MAILMNVGKNPSRLRDNIFMTKWVAIFRESGLRDDVTVANLQDACFEVGGLGQSSKPENFKSISK